MDGALDNPGELLVELACELIFEVGLLLKKLFTELMELERGIFLKLLNELFLEVMTGLEKVSLSSLSTRFDFCNDTADAF